MTEKELDQLGIIIAKILGEYLVDQFSYELRDGDGNPILIVNTIKGE